MTDNKPFKKTPLRLEAMRLIKAGVVSRGYGVRGWWIHASLPQPTKVGFMNRAIDSLFDAGMAKLVGQATARDHYAVLTEEGVGVLASWEAE